MHKSLRLYVSTALQKKIVYFSPTVQWEQNSGKCGVCGDAYHLSAPRPHEAGGDYGKGIISRRYAAGQVFFDFF